MAKKESKKQTRIHLAILQQIVTLSTSGFGVVAALAWNNVIQELVTTHIKPYLPKGSSILSLFIYATIVTILAVVVTIQLSRLIERLERLKK